jgi:hypothetical protein
MSLKQTLNSMEMEDGFGITIILIVEEMMRYILLQDFGLTNQLAIYGAILSTILWTNQLDIGQIAL